MTIISSSLSSRIEERVSAHENRYPRRKWPAEERENFFSSKLSFSQTTITPYFSSGIVERESYSSAQENRHPRGRWRTEGRKVIFTSRSIIHSLYHFPCRKLGITCSLRPCPHQSRNPATFKTTFFIGFYTNQPSVHTKQVNLLTYPWPIRAKNTRFRNNPDLCKRDLSLMGHFRVLPGLCFKTRVGAQPLIWKSFFILMQIKLIFTRKVVHLASFWKWGCLELGSGLFSLLVLSGLKYISSSHASLNDYFSFCRILKASGRLTSAIYGF